MMSPRTEMIEWCLSTFERAEFLKGQHVKTTGLPRKISLKNYIWCSNGVRHSDYSKITFP